MILSAVIHLTPTSEVSIPPFLGHKAQGWLLSEVHSYLPLLAERLHGKGGYTVSGIHRQIKGKPGKYYLRITSLADDLTNVLLEAVLPNIKLISFSPREAAKQKNNIEVNTYPDFKVDGYATNSTDHPLAGITSLIGLKNNAKLMKTQQLVFTSPTAFGSNGIDQPIPSPALMLRSWADKWNSCVSDLNERIGYPIQQFAQECVQITSLKNVHTENWYLPNHAKSNGFQGNVAFTLRFFDQCENWQAVWERAQFDLGLLSEFALYCGTGRHTTVGMGQTIPFRLFE